MLTIHGIQDRILSMDIRERFRKGSEARNVAIQLASLRKSLGMSQKELAKQVGTSQQQISRLESPSYEGHSLSMLRRVAEVLGATVHVEIKEKKKDPQSVIGEGNPTYRIKGRGRGTWSEFLKFERGFVRGEKVDISRNFRIVDALHKEAVALGMIPLKNPLDGIEVDIKIAKAVNSV
jgi:transcriptional regulator with XRE-family HTH domain